MNKSEKSLIHDDFELIQQMSQKKTTKKNTCTSKKNIKTILTYIKKCDKINNELMKYHHFTYCNNGDNV